MLKQPDTPIMKTLFYLLLTASLLVAAEPKREAGLSVHMLPERVAKISGGHGGFTVSDPTGKSDGKTYGDPKKLFEYFQSLPPPPRRIAFGLSPPIPHLTPKQKSQS
jgi:hypothetical protein